MRLFNHKNIRYIFFASSKYSLLIFLKITDLFTDLADSDTLGFSLIRLLNLLTTNLLKSMLSNQRQLS